MARKTLHPLPWLQYGCWLLGRWMDSHKPRWPKPVRMWASKKYGSDRFGTNPNWRKTNPGWIRQVELGRISEPKPLPWWLGQYAFGPLERPWWNLTRLVNKGRGGRGHRCEFTDPEMGALYGHKNGAFMDRMFDVFLSRIDGEA